MVPDFLMICPLIRPQPSKTFKLAGPVLDLTADDSSGDDKSASSICSQPHRTHLSTRSPKKLASDQSDSEVEDGIEAVMVRDLQDEALVEIYKNLPPLRFVLLPLLCYSWLIPR